MKNILINNQSAIEYLHSLISIKSSQREGKSSHILFKGIDQSHSFDAKEGELCSGKYFPADFSPAEKICFETDLLCRMLYTNWPKSLATAPETQIKRLDLVQIYKAKHKI